MIIILSIWLSYSFFGQLGQEFKRGVFQNSKKMLQHHAINVRMASYGMFIIMGLILQQSLYYYYLILIAGIIHIVFIVPDIFDFLVWRKIFYPEKPYGIPYEMNWLATNHNGYWLCNIHPIIVLFSTGSIKDVRATRWGLVRSGVAGIIITYFLIHLIG